MSDPQIHHDQSIAPPRTHTRRHTGSTGSLELPHVIVAESHPDTPCDGNTQLTIINLQQAEITALRAENLRLGEENLRLAAELVKTSKSLSSAVNSWMKAEDDLGKMLKHSQGTLRREMHTENEEGENEKEAEDESDPEIYEDALDALEISSDQGGTLVSLGLS